MKPETSPLLSLAVNLLVDIMITLFMYLMLLKEGIKRDVHNNMKSLKNYPFSNDDGPIQRFVSGTGKEMRVLELSQSESSLSSGSSLSCRLLSSLNFVYLTLL